MSKLLHIIKCHWFTHGRLYVLLIIFLLLSTGYNLLLPVTGDDADGPVHFQYIQYIAKNRRLPANQQERTEAGYVAGAGYPPLYQGIIGLLFSGIELEDIPLLQQPDGVGSLPRSSMSGPWIFQTIRMSYPYQGSVLLWHLSRFVSGLLSAGTILVTYFIVLKLFPGKKGIALPAAATLAFIPRFVFVSSIVSDDTMLAFTMALYLYAMVRVVKGHSHWLSFALVGITLGLAIITKFTIALIPLTTVLFLCFLAWRQSWPVLILVKRVLIVAFAAFLVSGWWFVFVIRHFSQVETLGLVTGVFSAIVPDVASNISGADLLNTLKGAEIAIDKRGADSFIAWLIYFTQSFWEARLVVLDEFLVLEHSFWLVWAVISLIAAGIVATWRRYNEVQRTFLLLLLIHVFAFFPLMLLRHYFNGFVEETAQGRQVLMPAAAAVGILLMVGWSHWTRLRTFNWLRPILPAVLLFWSVAQLYFVYALFPKPLPISLDETTRSKVPQVDVELNQMLFDAFELVGYSIHVLPDQSTLVVTLVWESHRPALKDYLTEIQLLDQTGQPVSGWIEHPAGGVYPTRAWGWGNEIYEEIKLPLYNLKPGDYTLQAYLAEAYQQPARRVTDALFAAPVKVEDRMAYPRHFSSLLIKTETESIRVKYQLWPFDFFNFGYPDYHYRATIPIAWTIDPSPASSQQTVILRLVAPDGQTFMSLNNQGNLNSFIVDPNWPSGLYRLKAEVIQNDQVIGESISPDFIKVENVPRQFTPPPMTHTVNANFYNFVNLLGYDLPESRLQPGEIVTVLAHWESLQIINRHLKIYNRLYDLDNNVWLVSDHETPPYQGGTITWVPGQIVSSESKMWLDPKIPNGIYNIHYGLYFEPDGGNPVHLPLIINGQVSDITYLTLGPIKIGAPPDDILALDVAPQYQLNHNLGNIIKLKGYDFAYLADSQEIHLTFYWESLDITSKNYTVFVHLQSETGQIISQKDNPPVNGIYPTSLWDVGEVIKDEFVLTLPAGFSIENNASLLVGLYDSATGERLAIMPDQVDNAITLKTFNIGP